MRNNEAIVALLHECYEHTKKRMRDAIDADASPETLRAFVEALQSFQCATNYLGERRYPDSPDVIRSIAVESLSPVEKRLQDILHRLEISLGTD